MALTYLQLVNRVIPRIGLSELSSGVSSSTGNTKIVAALINDAQDVLYNEADWVSLYKTRTFVTVSGTQNYALATLAADSAVFGRGIDLINVTSNYPLDEANIQDFDSVDANANSSAQPEYYTIIGDNYALYPIPNGAYTIRDRFWKSPAVLSSDSDTSDLPIECQPCIINFALARIKELLGSLSEGLIYEAQYKKYLEKAIASNARKLNKLSIFRDNYRRPMRGFGRMPGNYQRY